MVIERTRERGVEIGVEMRVGINRRGGDKQLNILGYPLKIEIIQRRM